MHMIVHIILLCSASRYTQLNNSHVDRSYIVTKNMNNCSNVYWQLISLN